jgi:hypothetical protein
MVALQTAGIRRGARRLAVQFGYFASAFSLLNICVFALDADRGVRWPGPLSQGGFLD